MRTQSGTRIGRSGIAVLLVLTSLLLQGSVRADTSLTVKQQNSINRMTIGLLQRGKNLVDVLDYVVEFEDCARAGECEGVALVTAAMKVGLRPDHLSEDSNSVAGLAGFWFVYEGFTNTTGRITVGPPPGGNGSDGILAGTAKFSPSGTADFRFYQDSDGNYDFDYSNNLGDHGTGYLLWTPTGCTLVGFFFSDTFKDQNGTFNSAILTFRRC